MDFLQHWHDLPDERTATVTRKRLEGAGAALVRVEVKAGAVAARHAHPTSSSSRCCPAAGR